MGATTGALALVLAVAVATASSATSATPLSKQDKALFAYAKCMREKGVEIPDPVKGKNGAYAFPAIPASITDAPGVRAKAQACSRAAGFAGTARRPQRPTFTAAQQKKLRQFQACLKKHGVTQAFGPPAAAYRRTEILPTGRLHPPARPRPPDRSGRSSMRRRGRR